MEQRNKAELVDFDVASVSVLLGVVAAGFIVLGVMIYFFGENQSSMTAENGQPTQSERMLRNKAEPGTGTVGQGSNQASQPTRNQADR